MAIRATFVLPKIKDMERTTAITHFMIKLADRLANYRVPGKLMPALASVRATFEAKRESNEDQRVEHQEKLKKEKEEKWAKMTPKERKKAMEKEEKRNKNRMMKKMKVK